MPAVGAAPLPAMQRAASNDATVLKARPSRVGNTAASMRVPDRKATIALPPRRRLERGRSGKEIDDDAGGVVGSQLRYREDVADRHAADPVHPVVAEADHGHVNGDRVTG